MTQVSQNQTHTSPFIATIGDVGITPYYVVTPRGSAPLATSQWVVSERVFRTRTTPTWAVVLAVFSVILFIWFFLIGLLGLLFLLAKEDQVAGTVDVHVYGDGLYHVAQIPVSLPFAVYQVHQQVAHAQSLAAQAQIGR